MGEGLHGITPQEVPPCCPQLKPAFSDTEWEQQPGPHADRPGVALSQGLLPGAVSPIPLSPGVWGNRALKREGERELSANRKEK